MINGLIESVRIGKRKMGERGGEVVHIFIPIIAEIFQKSEGRGEIVQRVRKVDAKSEVGERGGKMVDWFVKFSKKLEVEERGGEIVKTVRGIQFEQVG